MVSLREKLRRGFIASFATKYAGIFCQIILTAILARILSPEDFGIVAVVLVFVTFFNLISQIGLGPAIIQTKNLNDADIATLFYFTILIGAGFGIIFALASHWIAAFFDNSTYLHIVPWLGWAIFFQTLTIVPLAILRKAQRFLTVGLIEMISQFVAGLFAIILAIKGWSYYSLVAQAVLFAGSMFLANSFFARVPFRAGWSRNVIGKVFHYSLFQAGFDFVNYFARNLDNLLIGKFLGAESLGFYDRAYRLMLYPVRNLTFVITPVLHPVLSDFQHDKSRIFTAYLKLIRILALIGVPMSVFFYFTAEDIILLLYGKKWVAVIPIFKILSLSIWIQLIMSTVGSVFQAAGNTKWLFATGLFSSGFLVCAMFIGLPLGVEGIALSVVVAIYFIFIPNYFVLIKFVLQQSMKQFFLNFVKPFVVGLVLVGVGLVIEQFSINVGLAHLGVFSIALAGTYFLMILLTGEYVHLRMIGR